MTRHHPTPSERPGSPLQPRDLPTASTMPPHLRWLVLAFGVLVLAVMGWFAATSQPREHRGRPDRPTPTPTPSTTGRSLPARVVVSPLSLKEDHPTVAGLAGNRTTTLVVLGRVTATAPHYQDGLASTRLTIQIERATDRRLPTGTLITVTRDGGLISARQADPAADPRGMVDVRVDGAPNNRVGDLLLAFLHPDPNPGRQDGYAVVSSVHGLFLADQTGQFQRLGRLPDGFETSVDAAKAVDLTRPR